jgi:hypothetical protein
MTDPSPRQPWAEGPDEEAAPESWLTLDDDALLRRIETLDPAADEDERLLEVVTSRRHFFIRQEAAKRVKEKHRLYVFEDDRHVGQILVRHLSRLEDLTYLERISILSRHVEVRQAAQVQLARVWRRLEQSHPRETRPAPSVRPSAVPDGRGRAAASADSRRSVAISPSDSISPTSAPLEGDEVDGSLLGWAAHFIVERAWHHLGTKTTRELLRRSRDELSSSHPALALFRVAEDARVTLGLESGPRLTRAAVRDVAVWMAVFRRAAGRAAPGADAESVRASTALMADALRAAGFYAAFDDAEAALAL